MDKVRMGIVGVGSMGTNHAQYLVKGTVPNCELTAVADTSPDRIEWAASNLPESVKRFDSAAALIGSGEVDAVLIATPHYDHPDTAALAFKKGLHVLTEKPAGVYTTQVREMNAAAEKSGKVFGIMYQQRTRPAYRKLKDLVESGDLGELRRTNWIVTSWFRSQAYYNAGGWRATWRGEGGGVLINQCPHNIDLWQWTCGMPKRVRASCYEGKYHDIEVEDDVTAFVEYENGATGIFITTTGEAPGTNRLEVTGERGKVIVEDSTLTFWRARVPVSEFARTSKRAFANPEIWKVNVPTPGKFGGHAEITRGFVNAILKGTPQLAPGVEGIRGLSISNAIMLSAWTDAWVDLPLDEELFHEKLKEKIAASRYDPDAPNRVLTTDGSFGT